MREYGNFDLTAASPPQGFDEPLTISEVYQYLRLTVFSPADVDEADTIYGMIVAAREQAELIQGRDLVQKQLDLTLDCFRGEIELRRPLVSVDLVQYKDSAGTTTALTENTDFIVDLVRGLILPPYGESWPSFTAWPTSAVLVRFTAGGGDVSDAVKVGMKKLISLWYYGRLPQVAPSSGAETWLPIDVYRCLSFGKEVRAR